MTRDDVLQLKYSDRTLLSLMVELDAQREARMTAEENEARYRKAFEFLLKQEEFAPLHVKLRKHMKL